MLIFLKKINFYYLRSVFLISLSKDNIVENKLSHFDLFLQTNRSKFFKCLSRKEVGNQF
jgi:hypothetical protein